MRRRHLRSGYTTGACAAASTKAAAQLLIRKIWDSPSNCSKQESPASLEIITITLPDGDKASFKINKTSLTTNESEIIATASIIKFAGDDPDVTNGAEIIAEIAVKMHNSSPGLKITSQPAFSCQIHSQPVINIKGGKGVGLVTKPGLSVPIGFPAINPIPQKMIRDAIIEAFQEYGYLSFTPSELTVTISVTNGEKLAIKTLNSRLGIIGGISILGTTGIVKPLSSEAWTATISTSMDVAIATGCDEVVLSAGRASEKAHLTKYRFPEESYVMMGDYLEYSLLEAKRREFKRIHLCAQWAKLLKIAMSTPQTHVRYGAIDIKKAIRFLNQISISLPDEMEFNTAREIFHVINSTFNDPLSAFKEVCRHAKKYSETISGGMPVTCHFVSYEGGIILNT